MAALLFFVLMQLAWSFGQAGRVNGGGAFSYSDSSGKKLSGTYDLEDGRVVRTSGDKVPFSDIALPGYGYGFDYGFPGEDDFFPTYFSNLENLLQDALRRVAGLPFKHFNPFRAFHTDIQNQRLAFNAARKAFDLSSNQPGYFNNFAPRFPPRQPPRHFGGFEEGFPRFPSFPNFGRHRSPNSAYAGAAAGPGFRRQMAEIYPENPLTPNVNVNQISHFSDTPDRGGYYAVSSKSYSSSSNVNGEEVNHRRAETTVDDNGKVTSYKVEN